MSTPATLEELKLERLQYLKDLQARAAALNQGVEQYFHDPVGFARDCIDWGKDGGLTFYQDDVLDLLRDHKRVSVRGPHGLGKSMVSAVTVLWFAITRDAAGVDWKVVTTAGAWRQLINYLWPEIRKWANRLKWEKIRDAPFQNSEMLNLALRLNHGNAFAAAASNPALIEGAHADELFFLFDESKAIDAVTFNACEGAFSGTGNCYAMALSTPGPPQGRFYDIQTRKPGLEDWAVKHVTLDDAIRSGRISPEWAEQRRIQWGENSSMYQNRVLGEFYAGEEDSVVPLSWAEQAVERWHVWDQAGRPAQSGVKTVGVDVARQGTDKTCLALRDGDVVTEIRTYSLEDTMTTSGRVAGILEADPERTAIVDVIGIGAGVLDRLREQRLRVDGFNAANSSRRRDKTGEMGFANLRVEAWHHVRELLDPSASPAPTLCLPPDDDLLADLTTPRAAELLSGGKLKMESKDDIRKRIGRSTDKADAVIMALFTASGSWHDAYGTLKCHKCAGGFMASTPQGPRSKCPFCQTPIIFEHEVEAA
jgi:hypothetical protein